MINSTATHSRIFYPVAPRLIYRAVLDMMGIGICCALLCLCSERESLNVCEKWQCPLITYEVVIM